MAHAPSESPPRNETLQRHNRGHGRQCNTPPAGPMEFGAGTLLHVDDDADRSPPNPRRRQELVSADLASPLHPGQALSRRLLFPVRPGVGADDPAASADHARAERRQQDVIALLVTLQWRDIFRHFRFRGGRLPRLSVRRVSPERQGKNLTHGRPHERDEAILELVVAPAGARKFTARLDGRTLRDGSRGQIGKPCILWLPRSSYPRILRRSDIDSRPQPDIVQRPPPTRRGSAIRLAAPRRVMST
jgi:hypothetical protein